MTSLWEIDGGNVDRGYINLRDGQCEAGIRDQIDTMWAIYEPHADPDFRHGFARDPDARFWEMYLGCTLIQAGKALLPAVERLHKGGQPDICLLENGRRIWIEAIAPDRGEEVPDRVHGPVPINDGGGFEPGPVRQAQLRVTSALWTKTQTIERYLAEGVIGADEARLIAIGAGRFGIYVPEHPLPLILSSVFPFGDEFVVIDLESGAVVNQGFHASLQIERQGPAIPRTAFLDERFAGISGIIWSRIGIGNMSRAQRPLTFIHNPLATIAMPKQWGVWDREFVTTQDGDRLAATDILAARSA